MRKDQVEREKFYLAKESGAAPPRAGDELEGTLGEFNSYRGRKVEGEESEYGPREEGKLVKLWQVTEDGEQRVLCQGGFGGLGNDAFKSSRKTTPLEAQYGTFGEEKAVFFELQFLANVGLVGEPNQGKSTLLSSMTKARPKIANYPFTTVEPYLGVMTFADGKNLVIADTAGLIAGASTGRGLGFSFLRHIENCRMLLLVLAVPVEVLGDESLTDQEKATVVRQQYQKLKRELEAYSEKIEEKEQLILINKSDLYSEGLRAALGAVLADKGREVRLVSAATGEGMKELKQWLWQWAGEGKMRAGEEDKVRASD
jgi:GTP-binding protein